MQYRSDKVSWFDIAQSKELVEVVKVHVHDLALDPGLLHPFRPECNKRVLVQVEVCWVVVQNLLGYPWCCSLKLVVEDAQLWVVYDVKPSLHQIASVAVRTVPSYPSIG